MKGNHNKDISDSENSALQIYISNSNNNKTNLRAIVRMLFFLQHFLYKLTFLHDNLHEKMSWHVQNLMINVAQLDLRPSAHKKSHDKCPKFNYITNDAESYLT